MSCFQLDHVMPHGTVPDVTIVPTGRSYKDFRAVDAALGIDRKYRKEKRVSESLCMRVDPQSRRSVRNNVCLSPRRNMVTLSASPISAAG